jgi:hypothetical protein
MRKRAISSKASAHCQVLEGNVARQFSESLGNGGAELSLSEHSTSGWKAKMIKKAPFSLPKNRLFLQPLGNHCLKRLPVLH